MIKVGVTGVALALMLTGCSQLTVQSSGKGWAHQEGSEGTSQHGRNQNHFSKDDIQRDLVTVRSGDSLLGILNDTGVSPSFFYELDQVDQNRMKRLYPGDEIEISTNEDGQIVRLSRELRDDIWLVAERMGDHIMVSEKPLFSHYEEKVIVGDVGFDLRGDLRGEGVSNDLIDALLSLMTPKIDWMATYEPGDQYRIAYRQAFLNDKKVGSPEIDSIKITHQGESFYAFRHKTMNGVVAYYDENGKSLSPGWLLHPVKNFKRISSNFNPRRRHPITGRIRPHNGVDFAARRGTPIYAASSGKVDFSGYNGGYGNHVAIQHPGRIESSYSHMSRIADNVKRGMSVNKGDLIGYVGTTGLSTGPHLHYELRIDGKPVDPLKVDMVIANELRGREMARFMSSHINVGPSLTPDQDYMAFHQ